MGKLYSLTGILEVTVDDCMDAFSSSISDYEYAVVEKVVSRKHMDYAECPRKTLHPSQVRIWMRSMQYWKEKFRRYYKMRQKKILKMLIQLEMR